VTPKEQAVVMVYASIKDRVPYEQDVFIAAVKDWDVTPLVEQGEVIGGVIAKGNELHVGYGRKPRASIKSHIKKTLNELIAKYGCAVTLINADNKAGVKFCERLGFVKLSEKDGKIWLKCNRSNYL
jgi:hypothetical protein